jgi:hypothetical protein
VVDLQQVVAAGVGDQLGAVADQQPVGVAVDRWVGAGARAGALVGVVGELEAGKSATDRMPCRLTLRSLPRRRAPGPNDARVAGSRMSPSSR